MRILPTHGCILEPQVRDLYEEEKMRFIHLCGKYLLNTYSVPGAEESKFN